MAVHTSKCGCSTSWCAVHVFVLRGWITGANSSRLLTVQCGTQGKVTNFRHYHMNIRVKHRERIFACHYQNPRRSANCECAVNHQIYEEARAVLLRLHPFVKVTGIVGREYNDSTVGVPSCREYQYRMWFQDTLPTHHLCTSAIS